MNIDTVTIIVYKIKIGVKYLVDWIDPHKFITRHLTPERELDVRKDFR